MINILKDVSLLTAVSENTLKKFVPIITNCIGHAVNESICNETEITKIDLEVGQLHIKVADDGIHYRFVPSKDLEKVIKNTVITNSSPILRKLEINLQQKLDQTYKELL